ncbi:MAG TPA: ABC transporter substrate-binding protein [Xanthobacteraceae bacterium]|nr:ABC transporter substrate-binding protein [Xanthobacteraceae bacterium]
MGVGVLRRGFRCLATAVILALVLCTASPLHAQTALKVTLDGRIEGPSAPLLVALERGYFKSENLDVRIEPSAGGLEPITRVTSGAFDIGVGDINALIRYRDQNPSVPLKVVFVVNNRPSYAVIGRKSRGVSMPEDLQGKRLGAPTAEPATAAWPAFAKLNGLDATQVRVLNVGVPVREPMLAAGEVDAVTGASYGPPVALRQRGVPEEDISTLLMAHYGLDMYGTSVFVNTKVLAEKPEAVGAFLRALVLGIKDTLQEPAAAVPAVLRRANGANRELELERLQIVIRDSIVTPEVRRNGLGGIEPARFDSAIEQIAAGYAFKSKPKLEDIFDPSFLPDAILRRLE